MATAPKRYTIDSSSLIQGWRVLYPPDVFPPVWEKLEQLVSDDVLVASEEVLIELERKEDGLHTWAKRLGKMFVPHDADVQKAVRDVLKNHRFLLNTRKNRSGADPFVIAVGLTRKCDVVTQEGRSENPTKRPHIPDVCHAYGLRYLSLLDLLREQGFIFGKIRGGPHSLA